MEALHSTIFDPYVPHDRSDFLDDCTGNLLLIVAAFRLAIRLLVGIGRREVLVNQKVQKSAISALVNWVPLSLSFTGIPNRAYNPQKILIVITEMIRVVWMISVHLVTESTTIS